MNVSSAHSQLLPKYRPFLKWAGGKYRLLDKIHKTFPKNKKRLIEPFVGAGSVFLNSHFDEYILVDINQDLIHLFTIIQNQPNEFIEAANLLFTAPDANSEDFYYQCRTTFNSRQDPFTRATLFLYLNRFGYNGLCRYNNKKEFNVPFGDYLRPYFPEAEIRYFSQHAQKATFICGDFSEAFKYANAESIVYCDPPYAPLNQHSNFTQYAGNGFSLDHQVELARLARSTSTDIGAHVIISNHDTPFTRKIYQGAKFKRALVQRTISQNGQQRQKVKELLAVFKPAL